MVSYLNLPEIFYLGVYQPLTGECEGDFDFIEYTSRILDLKNCNSLVIEDFADCISSNLQDDFDCIVVVPPHHSEKDNSGIKILAQKITDKISDEDFDDFAFELAQMREESHKNIDYESAQYGELIGYYADLQMQALNNLYEFSFN